MRKREYTIRKRIADRLHLLASAIEDGRIAIEPIGEIICAIPSRFITGEIISAYQKYRREEAKRGPVAFDAASSTANDR